MAAEYILFTRSTEPPMPFYGPSSVISVQKWLVSLRDRGFSVPNNGRYALKVYAEALGVDIPLWHPGVLAVLRKPRPRALKQAPPMTVDFVIALERLAVSSNKPFGLRYYAAMFVLMTLASLRFCDTRDVSALWVTESSVCGISIDRKNKVGDLITWAAPRAGFATNSLWLAPITRMWKKITPRKGEFSNLFPMVSKEWEIISRRVGTNGTVQAALTRLEDMISIHLKLKLHSPRTFFATCASQLRFPREEREKLGHWVAGSVMPERYDRAVCVTELAIRDDIIRRITMDGWRPVNSFSVPTPSNPANTNSTGNNSDASQVSADTTNTNQPGGDVDNQKGEGLINSDSTSSASEEENIADLFS